MPDSGPSCYLYLFTPPKRRFEGADYFDWSFYSQGTQEEGVASADSFITAALEFFGDDEGQALARSPASPWHKGARLAQLVSRHRALIVLDGLEPLQYPPTSPLAGQIKDPGLAALLKGLAAQNHGLCVVTTRERVADLAPFRTGTAPEWALAHLSIRDGMELLEELGVRGAVTEFEQLVKEVKGHALTLNLLGRYLFQAHGGAIRKRHLIGFEEADAEIEGGHAFRVVGAYENWFASSGAKGQRALAMLRLLGLFNRPADPACIAALRGAPAIRGLTKPLLNLSVAEWNVTVERLVACGLVAVGEQSALDAHPLIREYFANQIRRRKPAAWRSANRRLYDHLKSSTKDKARAKLPDLQPLYQAMTHGRQAGLCGEPLCDVFIPRILRGEDFFSVMGLGAVRSDLDVLRPFFDAKWEIIAPDSISSEKTAMLLKHVGYCLRASGDLKEAVTLLQRASEAYSNLLKWPEAVSTQGLLAHVYSLLGQSAEAEEVALRSFELIGDSTPAWVQITALSRLAEVQMKTGQYRDCEKHFLRAMKLVHGSRGPKTELPRLFSTLRSRDAKVVVVGFIQRYCDFSIMSGKYSRAIWWGNLCESIIEKGSRAFRTDMHLGLCEMFRGQAMFGLAEQAIRKAGRRNVSTGPVVARLKEAETLLRRALQRFRNASRDNEIPRVLLCIADVLCRLENVDFPADGAIVGARREEARKLLDDAWEIAERGPMLLFMVDIHLCRARLFHADNPYPWSEARDSNGQRALNRGPKDDLDAARGLINHCGYHRRDRELADATKIILAEERKANMPANQEFDVFLSHNSKDKLVVRQLAEELKNRGLRVWLDEWELVPGRPWQEALEQIVQTTNSAAVLVGADGFGPWEMPEMRGCLSQFVERHLPVIPVLLPGAPAKPVLPLFLTQFTWVDLRGGTSKKGLDRLVWGITGKKP
jgi:tetratricopeptide (TPR) repeat protein